MDHIGYAALLELVRSSDQEIAQCRASAQRFYGFAPGEDEGLERGEIDTDHPVGLGQSHVDSAVSAKGAPGGDEHIVAAGRWDKRRCVVIAERMQGCTKPRCRRAPAIFGKNHDIGVVTLQRVGDSG
jgi:hypothetical protein